MCSIAGRCIISTHYLRLEDVQAVSGVLGKTLAELSKGAVERLENSNFGSREI